MSHEDLSIAFPIKTKIPSEDQFAFKGYDLTDPTQINNLMTRMNAFKVRIANDTTFIQTTSTALLQEIDVLLDELETIEVGNGLYLDTIKTRIDELEDLIESDRDAYEVKFPESILEMEEDLVNANATSIAEKIHASVENDLEIDPVDLPYDAGSTEQSFLRVNPSVWQKPYRINLVFRQPMQTLKLFSFTGFKAYYRDKTKPGAWIGSFVFRVDLKTKDGFNRFILSPSAFYQNNPSTESKDFDDESTNTILRYGAAFNSEIEYGTIRSNFDIELLHSRYDHKGELILRSKFSPTIDENNIDVIGINNPDYQIIEVTVTPILCKNLILPVISEEASSDKISIGSMVTRTSNNLQSSIGGYAAEINGHDVIGQREITKIQEIVIKGYHLSGTSDSFYGKNLTSLSFSKSDFSKEITDVMKPFFEGRHNQWLDAIGSIYINQEEIPIEMVRFDSFASGEKVSERVIFKFHRKYRRDKKTVDGKSYFDLLKLPYAIRTNAIDGEDPTQYENLKASIGFIYCYGNVMLVVPFHEEIDDLVPGSKISYASRPYLYHTFEPVSGYTVDKVWPFVVEEEIRAYYTMYNSGTDTLKLYFLDGNRNKKELFSTTVGGKVGLRNAKLVNVGGCFASFTFICRDSTKNLDPTPIQNAMYNVYDAHGKRVFYESVPSNESAVSFEADNAYWNAVSTPIDLPTISSDDRFEFFGSSSTDIFKFRYDRKFTAPQNSVFQNERALCILENRFDPDWVYWATNNFQIKRKHRTNGTVETIAGTGSSGSAGDGGLATLATLTFPPTLNFGVVAKNGAVYLATGSRTVRKIIIGGNISSIDMPNVDDVTNCLTTDALGNIYVSVSWLKIGKITESDVTSIVAGNGTAAPNGPVVNDAQNTALTTALSMQGVGNAFVSDSVGNVYFTKAGTDNLLFYYSSEFGAFRRVSATTTGILTEDEIGDTFPIRITTSSVHLMVDEMDRVWWFDTVIATGHGVFDLVTGKHKVYTGSMNVVPNASVTTLRFDFFGYTFSQDERLIKDEGSIAGLGTVRAISQGSSSYEFPVVGFSNATGSGDPSVNLLAQKYIDYPWRKFVSKNTGFTTDGVIQNLNAIRLQYHYAIGPIAKVSVGSSVRMQNWKGIDLETDRWVKAGCLDFPILTSYGSSIIHEQAIVFMNSLITVFKATSDNTHKIVVTRGRDRKNRITIRQSLVIDKPYPMTDFRLGNVDSLSRFALFEYFESGVKTWKIVDYENNVLDISALIASYGDRSIDTIPSTGIYCGFIPHNVPSTTTLYPGAVFSNQEALTPIDIDSFIDAFRIRTVKITVEPEKIVKLNKQLLASSYKTLRRPKLHGVHLKLLMN